MSGPSRHQRMFLLLPARVDSVLETRPKDPIVMGKAYRGAPCLFWEAHVILCPRGGSRVPPTERPLREEGPGVQYPSRARYTRCPSLLCQTRLPVVSPHFLATEPQTTKWLPFEATSLGVLCHAAVGGCYSIKGRSKGPRVGATARPEPLGPGEQLGCGGRSRAAGRGVGGKGLRESGMILGSSAE